MSAEIAENERPVPPAVEPHRTNRVTDKLGRLPLVGTVSVITGLLLWELVSRLIVAKIGRASCRERV